MGSLCVDDLFAGPGGATLGILEACPQSSVVGYDQDPDCVSTQRANGLTCRQTRLGSGQAPERLEPYVLGVPSLVWASPPCQPFSQGSIRDYGGAGGTDDRDGVPAFLETLRARADVELFVFENVRGLTFRKHRDYLEQLLGFCRDQGFKVEWEVVNAAELGVPQSRKRLIIMGSRSGALQWPSTRAAPTMAEALGWDESTVREREVNGDASWVFERPAMTVVGSFAPEVMAGPGYRKAGDGPRQRAPGSVRITEDEAALLQGFPIGFAFSGSKTSRWRQIGDAVPVGMASELVRALVEGLGIHTEED